MKQMNHKFSNMNETIATATVSMIQRDKLMEKIDSLIKEGTEPLTAPSRLADILGELSAFYSLLMDMYDEMEVEYNERWLQIRENVKSVAETDRKIEMEIIGVKRKKIKHKLNVVEKVMSSIKVRLRIKEAEYRNQI